MRTRLIGLGTLAAALLAASSVSAHVNVVFDKVENVKGPG
jgi:hypothetical protein